MLRRAGRHVGVAGERVGAHRPQSRLRHTARPRPVEEVRLALPARAAGYSRYTSAHEVLALADDHLRQVRLNLARDGAGALTQLRLAAAKLEALESQAEWLGRDEGAQALSRQLRLLELKVRSAETSPETRLRAATALLEEGCHWVGNGDLWLGRAHFRAARDEGEGLQLESGRLEPSVRARAERLLSDVARALEAASRLD